MEPQEIQHGKEKIFVGSHYISRIPGYFKKIVPKANRFVLLTDSNVFRHYGTEIEKSLRAENLDYIIRVLEPGEHTKCRKVKEEIEDWMFQLGCLRDSCVVALGGGVIGDLSGFVASTYMRGIPFIQIPTTLLAMVDSSIGGKTGIDVPAGKNLIGAFHHPAAIFIDTAVLSTLPRREFCNGMAEVIKTALIRDANLFQLLEEKVEQVFQMDAQILTEVIKHTASIKDEVVSIDEREDGLRCILNYGHTIGHAIEALSNFSLLHGECVAIGMMLETKLSMYMGHAQPSVFGRIIRCIQNYNLPIKIPAEFVDKITSEAILNKMKIDKKNANKQIRCVIIKDIGSVFEYPIPIEPHLFRLTLLPQLRIKPGAKDGEITVPGSKSISNRALILAALGKGECRIHGLLQADDTDLMLDALRQLGVKFSWSPDGKVLTIVGSGGSFKAPTKPLYLGNAGTTSRFLTTLCALIDGKTQLTGSARLKERPIQDLVDSLKQNGCNIKFLGKEGFFPFEIVGTGLPGGKMSMSANISSQYVSSVLLSGPYANESVDLSLTGRSVSQPYIDMTIKMMEQFGVKVTHDEVNHRYTIPKAVYTNPADFVVESDASSATYPLAIAAIAGRKITVHNVGNKSLQGDAQFCTVLEKMGCKVTQTETFTTVEGPEGGKLRGVDSLDMADMTDAFMTAAVLAAVATGTTRITNIANQRVKECNRIAAMVEQFTKCGVVSRELEDGIEIEGCGNDLSRIHSAEIDCYLDHRIAMSFGVLGTRVPGIIVKDKECTDKTFPEFWVEINKHFGVEFDVPDLVEGPQKKAEPAQQSNTVQDPSVIIIGMRGSGKSTLGAALARDLERKFFDIDTEFEREIGMKIKEFVAQNSWPEFRKREEETLRKVIQENPSGAVIATGGGVIETPTAFDFLSKYKGPIIQLSRSIEDIKVELDQDTNRAQLGESVHDIWNRRKPLYEKLSHFEFNIAQGEKEWPRIELDLLKFVRRILKPQEWHKFLLDQVQHPTFFLSLTFPNIKESFILLDNATEGVQAIELRVDLLENHSIDFVKEQVSLLQRKTALPIIFTVRSKGQGGGFTGSVQQMFDLLQLAVRIGCEFIDMEVAWDSIHKSHLLKNKGISKIIGSHHDFSTDLSITDATLKQLFNKCLVNDKVDVLKVVVMAQRVDDCYTMQRVLKHFEELRTKSPEMKNVIGLIGLCAGDSGKLSRVMNRFMTPVTHSALPFKAAPGQLSVDEILTLRKQLGIEFKEESVHKFYLFGTPIAHSLSPLLHNTGFKYYQLPFVYGLCDTPDIETVVQTLNRPDTRGGSVTIPHKQAIVPHINELSDSAKQIGAVNTIIKTDGKLFGDNTDWLAIFKLVNAKLELRQNKSATPTGLVIGAGGTSHAACYALNVLGVKFHIWNRSIDKAEELAKKFGGLACSDLAKLTDKVDIVIGTVPPTAQFTLPEHLLHRDLIVVELVYHPRKTALVQQAENMKCQTVEGIELLLEQGLVQFKLFSRREAPRKEIVQQFIEKYSQGEMKNDLPASFRLFN